MASEWYYESMGQILGPVTAPELLQKVRRGEIREATRVRKDDSQWVDAIEVGGLFEAAQRAAVSYTCPYCGGETEKPPTLCLQCDREISAAYLKRDKTASPPAQTPTVRGKETNGVPPSRKRGEAGELDVEGEQTPSMMRWLRSWVR
jgi:hypothetical protein